jgi:hypothetical protein
VNVDDLQVVALRVDAFDGLGMVADDVRVASRVSARDRKSSKLVVTTRLEIRLSSSRCARRKLAWEMNLPSISWRK